MNKLNTMDSKVYIFLADGFEEMEALVPLDSFDFADADVMAAVVEEATDGFFRGGRR